MHDAGLGCIVCCAAGSTGTFGTFKWKGCGTSRCLRTQKLEKHHNSAEHQRNAAKFLGLGDEASLASPPSNEMQQILRQLLEGSLFGSASSKARAMAWCLHEALMDMDRAFVREATTIALCRDDRHQRLLIRFTGSNAKLETRSGVLGVGIDKGACADSIVDATRSVFETFCTPRRDAPDHGAGHHEHADIDTNLLTHLKDKVEVIIVDEEAAELKAADIGRGRRMSALELEPITPNLKFVARDKAHGYRRTVSNRTRIRCSDNPKC